MGKMDGSIVDGGVSYATVAHQMICCHNSSFQRRSHPLLPSSIVNTDLVLKFVCFAIASRHYNLSLGLSGWTISVQACRTLEGYLTVYSPNLEAFHSI